MELRHRVLPPPPPPPTPPRHPKASLPGLMYFLNCEILMSRDRLGCHSIARSISLSVAREAQTYFRWSLISLRILTFLEGEKRRPEIRLRFAGYFNYLQFINMIYLTRLFYFRYRVFSKLMISRLSSWKNFFVILIFITSQSWAGGGRACPTLHPPAAHAKIIQKNRAPLKDKCVILL